MKVVVSCSGKFHAFALAEQLEQHDLLVQLITSYSSIKTPWLAKFVKRIDKEIIPKSKIKTNILTAVGLKLLNKPRLFNTLFDKWVAFKLHFINADVFIGWSGMCLHSIRAAQKKGMLTIVERGSSHIEYQNEILKTEYQRFGIIFNIDKKIIANELLEYQLAHYISIPSLFVKNSFLEKGDFETKLLLNNYGASVYFKNDNALLNKKNKFRILYLGTLNIRKGLVYLFEALRLLNICNPNYEVWFIGKVEKELERTVTAYKQENWHFLGHIFHYDLPKYITACDVAVHPSLEEGLSMVIAQIIACRVPVIASTNSGGQDIIEEGKTGFIVPIRDPQSIADKLLLLMEHEEVLINMRKSEVIVPTWDSYGLRYITNLKDKLIEQKKKPCYSNIFTY